MQPILQIGACTYTHSLLPGTGHIALLQENVEPEAVAKLVAKSLLKPDTTLALISQFRPVLLQLCLALTKLADELPAADAPALYIAAVQILECAPQLQRSVKIQSVTLFALQRCKPLSNQCL